MLSSLNLNGTTYEFTERKVLWENPNSQINFEKQIISINNLSKYKFCLIYAWMGTSSFIRTTIVFSELGNHQLSYITYSSARNSIELYYRHFFVYDNSIDFSDAVRLITVNGTNEYASGGGVNIHLVPKIIYGFR